VWIINQGLQQAYENEIEQVKQQFALRMLDLESNPPAPIEVEQLPPEAAPKEIDGILIAPGQWYGRDETGRLLTISDSDIGGPLDFWVEVPGPTPEPVQ
jgi:hypothetical protein